MNVLYTSTSYPPVVGGAQVHLHELVRRMACEHQVRVVSHWRTKRYDWLLGTTLRAPTTTEHYHIDGVPVSTLSWSWPERLALVPPVLAFYPLQYWAVTQIALPLCKKLDDLAAPETSLVHNVRIGREGLSWASFYLARQRDVPFVFTPLHHPRWNTWFHRAYLTLYRQADLVIALTETERQTLIQLGVSAERIVVTGVGPIVTQAPVDAEAFRARHGLGDEPFVLFLGQKYPYKGVASVLAAAPLVWQRFPEVRFVFIGPRTPHSIQLFANQHDPRIVEIDQVDLEEKCAALAACIILCVPSNQESFGGVFLEAWSYAKPVVGGDIPPVRDVLSVGEDGLVAPQDGAEIADRLLCLLSEPALAARMGAAGQHKVETTYNWSYFTQRTLDAYQHVLSQG